MRVLILGSHPANSYSMLRYTESLAAAYSRLGHSVKLLRPPALISGSLRPGGFRKAVVYVEQLLVFPWIYAVEARRSELIHLADHSDAVWLLSLPRRLRQIVTCHDLVAVRAALGEIPEHRPAYSGRLYQFLVRCGLRRASRIVAVSDATLADVRRLIPRTPAGRIYNPISNSIASADPTITVEEPYALIVGSTGWRKRRDLGLRVWARVRTVAGLENLRLTIVGPPLEQHELNLLLKNGIPLDHVTHFDGVTDAKVSELYANALTLIQMSRYEGFCWPILEANVFGVVAICADEAVLRETGDGNVFVPASLIGVDWMMIADAVASADTKMILAERARTFSEGAFDRDLSDLHRILAEPNGDKWRLSK
ncbi:hypothetical protein SRABI26_04141 [Arthrobacter sp. Bi26]|nr:hypothetical protein SRABI26_04141 [Arthrobacter sp. Bi26]